MRKPPKDTVRFEVRGVSRTLKDRFSYWCRHVEKKPQAQVLEEMINDKIKNAPPELMAASTLEVLGRE